MFDEKLFFSNVLGFTPGWGYKHYNEYISQKIVNLSTTNKNYILNQIVLMKAYYPAFAKLFYIHLF